MRAGRTGPPRIGAIPAALTVTPLLIAPFCEQHPRVRISVLCGHVATRHWSTVIGPARPDMVGVPEGMRIVPMRRPVGTVALRDPAANAAGRTTCRCPATRARSRTSYPATGP